MKGTETDGDDLQRILKRADALAKAGDSTGAVEEYIRYCQTLTPARPLRAAAIRQQVLALKPERRDVRRDLVEDLTTLGLLEDARAELRRIVAESEVAGDRRTKDEALARLRDLSRD